MNNEAGNGADFIAANEMNGTAMNGLMSPGTNIMINFITSKIYSAVLTSKNIFGLPICEVII
jgi:hypothetical protein